MIPNRRGARHEQHLHGHWWCRKGLCSISPVVGQPRQQEAICDAHRGSRHVLSCVDPEPKVGKRPGRQVPDLNPKPRSTSAEPSAKTGGNSITFFNKI